VRTYDAFIIITLSVAVVHYERTDRTGITLCKRSLVVRVVFLFSHDRPTMVPIIIIIVLWLVLSAFSPRITIITAKTIGLVISDKYKMHNNILHVDARTCIIVERAYIILCQYYNNIIHYIISWQGGEHFIIMASSVWQFKYRYVV